MAQIRVRYEVDYTVLPIRKIGREQQYECSGTVRFLDFSNCSAHQPIVDETFRIIRSSIVDKTILLCTEMDEQEGANFPQKRRLQFSGEKTIELATSN